MPISNVALSPSSAPSWTAPAVPFWRRRKTGGTYRLELDPLTIELLRGAHPNTHGRDDVVFAHGDGKPWRPNHVTKRFIAARTAAGLAHFRLHDLRHFMATQMLAAGVPIATVSQRLGHARASTTLDVYAHAVPGGDRAAAIALAALLDR